MEQHVLKSGPIPKIRCVRPTLTTKLGDMLPPACSTSNPRMLKWPEVCIKKNSAVQSNQCYQHEHCLPSLATFNIAVYLAYVHCLVFGFSHRLLHGSATHRIVLRSVLCMLKQEWRVFSSPHPDPLTQCFVHWRDSPRFLQLIDIFLRLLSRYQALSMNYELRRKSLQF